MADLQGVWTGIAIAAIVVIGFQVITHVCRCCGMTGVPEITIIPMPWSDKPMLGKDRNMYTIWGTPRGDFAEGGRLAHGDVDIDTRLGGIHQSHIGMSGPQYCPASNPNCGNERLNIYPIEQQDPQGMHHHHNPMGFRLPDNEVLIDTNKRRIGMPYNRMMRPCPAGDVICDNPLGMARYCNASDPDCKVGGVAPSAVYCKYNEPCCANVPHASWPHRGCPPTDTTMMMPPTDETVASSDNVGGIPVGYHKYGRGNSRKFSKLNPVSPSSDYVGRMLPEGTGGSSREFIQPDPRRTVRYWDQSQVDRFSYDGNVTI